MNSILRIFLILIAIISFNSTLKCQQTDLWYPVEYSGAMGDGSTNDLNAIQQAINTKKIACLSPNKTYIINGTLTINADQTLFIPKSSTLIFNANYASNEAIIMNEGTLKGDGAIISTRYNWNRNNWDLNKTKAAIKFIGSYSKVEIGRICGFEKGIVMEGNYGLLGCNVNVGSFLNVLECFVINPYGEEGFVNQNYFHWDATEINWDNDSSKRPYSCGVYMNGAGEPNHNTFSGYIKDYYIGLRLSGAFNRFLGLGLVNCDKKVVINYAGTGKFTRHNWIFGEYGGATEFYDKIYNEQPGRIIQDALQIYGAEGSNWLNSVRYRSMSSLSDSTLKTDINTIDSALEKVLMLRGTTFRFKSEEIDSDHDRLSYGFIAQEVKEVIPDLVECIGFDSLYTVDYVGVLPVLVEATKEQQLLIKDNDIEIDDIKKRLKELEDKLMKNKKNNIK